MREHAVAPVLRVIVAVGRARTRATAESAFDRRRVDEPFGELAGKLRIPQRGEQRGASHEAETQPFRGVSGAPEVMHEPLHFRHDVPRPFHRLPGREGREAAQGQASVFEARLAQLPAAAFGDEEHRSGPGPEERKQPRANHGKRVDSRHLVRAKRVEPGLNPLGTDDGGKEDPVVAPPIRHPSLPPGGDEGRAGKQSGAPCLEDRPPRGAVHVRGRLRAGSPPRRDRPERGSAVGRRARHSAGARRIRPRPR